ncbi:MAG: hypothetical protein ACYC2O_03460 [Microthrixaceae bacterium]
MNVPAKLAAFGALSAVVFVAALGVGAAVGPVDTEDRPASHTPSIDGIHDTTGGDEMLAMDHTATTPGGLETAQAGYTLVPTETALEATDTADYRFMIEGPDGLPVTEYSEEHDKELHLIVVRRDLSGYQHLHPTRDAQGVWSTIADLSVPGTYRVLADFTPAASGDGLTLGTDLQVPGEQRATPLPAPSRTAEIDGYTVTLTGDLVPGSSSALTLSVAEDGRPVTNLEPYLGAYGHLVALRSGDVAYLHVHPEGDPGDGTTTAGPTIDFAASVPSAGTYRLYLDFLHEGVVRTAEFTATAAADVPTGATTNSSTTTLPTASHDDSDGHHTNGAGR